ncbi:type IV secretion system protein [Candidatus Saccharibacteria bacterium]|nr:type IV secretion system protein [Candidatus Saccharibacteria bacterium]
MKQLGILVATGILTLLLAFSYSSVANAVSADEILPGSGNGSVTTCSYENLGWVLCPVLTATATAGDFAFTFMVQSFTQLEIGLFNSGSGAAQAGAIVRTIANVLFVIAFLLIVYSLMTGRGIGNYNLKRLVPRFIVAVIFVQASFYICQVMIDISNIVGVWIQQALVEGVAKNIGASAMPIASKLGEDINPLSSIANGVMTKSDIAWPLLAPLAAIVMSAAIICSVLIVLLIIRKVLVVALALIAPLAFVAYLLPNTSDYFSKWLKLFVHTLLLFPVISVLIGTGQIVSASILKAGGSDYQVENDDIIVNKKSGSATLYLVAAGAAVLPLVGTWYAFKAVTNGIDAAGARVSRDGFRRSSKEREEKAKQREQTTMDMNKQSMMLRGINRLQQLNVAKEGESTSIFSRATGAHRGRGKHATKSPEQARFDDQVQQRLGEIRSGASASSSTPQEVYSQALQRYQDRVGDASDGGLNINSYEGIDLKASEAYLLESLGKGSSAVGAVVATGGNDGKKDEKQEDEKKSAGISSLNRDGKNGSGSSGNNGSGGGDQAPQDAYRPPSTGGAGIAPQGSAPMPSPQGGAPVIVQQITSPGAAEALAGMSSGVASGTGYAPRRLAQDNNELLAKARAAKYVAETQDLLVQETDPVDKNSDLGSK